MIETFTYLALALLRSPILAAAVMFTFGVHAAVWGSTSMTVRQRAVPGHLLGRVNSVYMLGSVGAIAVGTLVGGALAERWGVTAPLWFTFIGSAVITAMMWRTFLTHRARRRPARRGKRDAPVTDHRIRRVAFVGPRSLIVRRRLRGGVRW